MAEDLFPHLAKQFYSVQRARGPLLGDGLDVQRWVNRRVWKEDKHKRCEKWCTRGNKATLLVQPKDLFVPGV